LARYYLESFGEKYQRPIMPWGSDFVAALLTHSWPGNVRELRDAMERLALLAPGPNLTAADVQQYCVDAVLEDNPDSDHQIALRF
jgi:DNA-binding NtrC family response regulator